ncbi:MAG: hypothetical protein U0V70_06495 [Terriglobia bacterium]
MLKSKDGSENAPVTRPIFPGNVSEVPVPIIRRGISSTNRRDEQILIAIIVNISEGGGDADSIGKTTPACFVTLRNCPAPNFPGDSPT